MRQEGETGVGGWGGNEHQPLILRSPTSTAALHTCSACLYTAFASAFARVFLHAYNPQLFVWVFAWVFVPGVSQLDALVTPGQQV